MLKLPLPGFRPYLALLAATALAAGLGTPARACESVDGIMCALSPPDVQAGARGEGAPGVRAKIVNVLQTAWKLAGSSDFDGARAKVQPLLALDRKTLAEIAAVDRAIAFIAFGAKDFKAAADAFAHSLDAGAVDKAELPSRLAALTQLYFETRNFPKAIAMGERYLAEVGPDPDILIILAQSYIIARDYPASATAARQALAHADAAKTPVKEQWLQLAMSAAYYVHDTAGVIANLERLVELYPQAKYWADLLRYVAREPADTLDAYRLRLATGAMTDANQYADMAALAIDTGLPGEARSILARASDAGLGAGQEGLARAAARAANDDFKTLPRCETDARAARTGDAEIQTGQAYLSYGNTAKAIDLMRDGLARGVKDRDGALLRLGQAYAEAGERDAALKTFGEISADAPVARMARLWRIALTHPPAGTTTLAALRH